MTVQLCHALHADVPSTTYKLFIRDYGLPSPAQAAAFPCKSATRGLSARLFSRRKETANEMAKFAVFKSRG